MGLASSRKNDDGSWGPSKMALMDPKAISCPTPLKFDAACAGMYKGDKKILVIGSEGYLLECRNGKNFQTGHNPTELFVPLAHLAHAGYTFEFATPNGKIFPVEEFARVGVKACGLTEEVGKVEKTNQAGLANPIKISEGLTNLQAGKYMMVFIPGGHGALNMKRDVSKAETGKILEFCHANSLPTASLCHGPDALRCAAKGTYKGYKVSAFLDKNDKQAATFGYLPGKLIEEDFPQKNLIAEQGCIYTNKKNDDSVTVYKELITGSTNLAAQRFGAAMVQELKNKAEAKGEKKDSLIVTSMEALAIAPTKLTCKCKAVSFEVFAKEPIAAAYCHCKDCQAFFGAACAKLTGIHEEDLKITQGQDKLVTEDRGEKGVRHACGDCKGYVFNKYPIGLLAVQSDDLGPKFQPTMHIHYDERKTDVKDDLPKHDGPPPLNILTDQ